MRPIEERKVSSGSQVAAVKIRTSIKIPLGTVNTWTVII